MSSYTQQQPEPKAALKVDLPWVLVQHVKVTASDRGVLMKDLVAEAITNHIGHPRSGTAKSSRRT